MRRAPQILSLPQSMALTIAAMCAATFAVSVVLAVAAVAERLAWMSEKYDALLNSVVDTQLAGQISRIDHELELINTLLDHKTKLAGEVDLAKIELQVHGLQPAEHSIFFYDASNRRLNAHPEFIPSSDYQVETRPWFVLATDGRPQARWTEPYINTSSGQSVVSRVKATRSKTGQLLRVAGVGLPLSQLQASLEQAVGHSPIVLQIRTTAERQILAATYDRANPVDDAMIANAAPLGDTLAVLRYGLLRQQTLSDPDWDVLLYLPASQVRTLLWIELKRHAAPMLGLLTLLLLAFGFLARRFWHERQLLAEALDALKHGRSSPPDRARQRLWLMDEPVRAMHRLARQVDDDRHQARHDALTNIPNRRAFESDLDARLLSGERFALLSFDLDHFKQINDSHGHAVGDSVLKRVSAAIVESDLPLTLYRVGGDEFAALVAPGAGLDSICEALLERVRALSWREPDIHATLSIGATESVEAKSREHLLALTDARLYLSKQGGRNRATWSGEAPAPSKILVKD